MCEAGCILGRTWICYLWGFFILHLCIQNLMLWMMTSLSLTSLRVNTDLMSLTQHHSLDKPVGFPLTVINMSVCPPPPPRLLMLHLRSSGRWRRKKRSARRRKRSWQSWMQMVKPTVTLRWALIFTVWLHVLIWDLTPTWSCLSVRHAILAWLRTIGWS